MMSTRRLASTWHGLVAAEAQSGASRAVVVADIQPGSPAEVAGLKAGDQMVRVGDLEVTNVIDIERGLLDVAPGQQAKVVVRRAGQEQALALEPRPLSRAAAADAGEQVWRVLGLKTTPVTPEYVTVASPKLRGGLYVQAVSPGSPGSLASIQQGDILVGMNAGTRHWETIRPDNILFILRQPEVASAQTLQFYIVRKNGLRQGVMSLAEVPARNTISR